MTGLFITSTGTGIGKTFVTQRLLQWDGCQQNILSASKPVITGWPINEAQIPQTDTGILLHMQQYPLTPRTIDQMSPWRFAPPLAPSMAASKEGKEISFSALIKHCQDEIHQAKAAKKIHLIEGVGGVMVPIVGQFTVVDWIAQLGCPCIVVTGSYLGSLSHTLTALSVLQMKGIEILAVVVNETAQSTVSLEETHEYLAAHLSPLEVIAMPIDIQQQANKAISTLYLQLEKRFTI